MKSLTKFNKKIKKVKINTAKEKILHLKSVTKTFAVLISVKYGRKRFFANIFNKGKSKRKSTKWDYFSWSQRLNLYQFKKKKKKS